MRRNFGDDDFRTFDYVARIRDEIFQRDTEHSHRLDLIQKGPRGSRSIRTVQGYGLNYVGFIIGLDLRCDPAQRRLFVDRDSYFDKKGKENNSALGKTYSDDDLLRFITQIYAVLMMRGIRGMYVYACDPGLWEYLKGLIPFHS
ncbi:hypothetical protein LRP88_02414 [Fusarium phalaenopsidis]